MSTILRNCELDHFGRCNCVSFVNLKRDNIILTLEMLDLRDHAFSNCHDVDLPVDFVLLSTIRPS